MKIKTPITLAFIFFITLAPVEAHPGRTASDGCHYCRTNCDKWGVAWNERHCHGGESAPIVESQPVYVQPTEYIYPTTRPTTIPTRIPTTRPTAVPTNSPTSTPTKVPTIMITSTPTSSQISHQPVEANTTENKPTIGETTTGLGILGGMGYGVYWLAKKVLSRFRS